MKPWLHDTARKRFHFRVMFAIGYFLRLVAAAFCTEYAMATACLGGLPCLISVLMFWTNAFSDADCFSGIVLFGLFKFSLDSANNFFAGFVFSFLLSSKNAN
jgi:hypothetical protein